MLEADMKKTKSNQAAGRTARHAADMIGKGLRRAALLLAVVAGLSSCLKGDDTEVVYYDDTAVTAFTLGTVTRTLHTTSSTGEDSTYTASVTGSRYAFSIDQQQGLIYNVDSLPVGCDVSHVLATITTKNSGTVILNPRTSDGTQDSLVLYSSTDSIDFSEPLELQVYNNARTAYRKYTVEVRVSRQESNVFAWRQATLDDGELDQLLDRQVIVADVADVIAGADLDTSADWLPVRELNVVEWPLRTNPNYSCRLLVGNRSVEEYPADTTAVAWGRVVASDASGVQQPWLYYVPAADNKYLLPRLEHLQVVGYADRLLAIGGKGLGACEADAYTCFYESGDGGITWMESTTFTMPEGLEVEGQCVLIADESSRLWLVADGGRQVWCGSLNE